jgi:hypothetical protein
MSAITSVGNNTIALADVVKTVGTLPFGNTKEAPTVKPDSGQNEGHYNLNEGLVYEVYDKQGKVSFRVPQKLDPIDEIA